MATATLERPAGGTGGQHAEPPRIWPEIDIGVLGVCGEFSSGKTLLLLTIDPLHTRMYDNEGSSLTYRGLGFDHVDMSRELQKAFGAKASEHTPALTLTPTFGAKKITQDYRPIDRFVWWYNDIKANCPPGKYTVIATDPISEIEAGVCDYVRLNHLDFGISAGQLAKGGGIFWGAVKDFWQQIIDEIRVRCQTFAFAAHMRDEFIGGSPSGKREPKGKETLFQLASLYLLLERPKNDKGEQHDIPSAIVLKERLSKAMIVDGKPQIVPVMPPRLPQATPDAIRSYIINPPNYRKLKKEELAPEHKMSDDERLRLQAYASERQAEAAQAELSRADMMLKAAERQAAITLGVVPATDRSADAAAHRQAEAVARVPVPGGCFDHQIQHIRELAETLCTEDEFAAALDEHHPGATRIIELSEAEAERLIAWLKSTEAGKHQNGHTESTAAPFDGGQKIAPQEILFATPGQVATIRGLLDDAFDSDEEVARMLGMYGAEKVDQLHIQAAREVLHKILGLIAERNELVTKAQVNAIRELAGATNWLDTEQDAFLAQFGVSTFRSLTARQANSAITKLIHIEIGLPGKEDELPKN